MPGVTHSNIPLSNNVFVNGGPTLGGAVADALGLPDTVGISDAEARAIISGRAAEIAAGNDPDLNEALETYGGGLPNGSSPVTGQDGAIASPGSDTATGRDATEDADIPRPTSEWINVQSHVNPRVLPDVWTKLENFAKSLGRVITLNSAYRTPEYNARVGGAKNSLHVQRKAIDAGFTGIGCYDSFCHIDVGSKRHWGSSGSYTSQFEQYKTVLRSNGYTV